MTWLHFLLTRHRCPNLLPVLPVTNHSLQNATPASSTPKNSTVKKQAMIRNAVILSVIVSLTAVISSARPDLAVPAVIDDVTASDLPLTSAEKTETATVDLRPLHLTAVASDPDQIAHSFRLPSVRHASRPLSLINRRPIEIRYGHDMLMSPAKKKCKKMRTRMKMKKREHDESDSEDEDEAEHEERKRLRKMMKRRMRMERENGGGFVKWISGFMNRF